MPVVLVVLYPLLVHLSVLYSEPLLQALALVSLAAGFTYSGLKQKQKFLWGFFVLFSASSLLLAKYNKAIFLLYLPPIAFPSLLAAVFINTLLPGREALVTAIGEASRGPLSDEMRRYTKIVTISWSVAFCCMALVAAGLAAFADIKLWSWVTSVGNYVLIGIMFWGEFVFRKMRFPDHDHPGFIEYIKIVVTANVAKR